MSVFLSGNGPSADIGETFHVNNQSWFEIANYCIEKCPPDAVGRPELWWSDDVEDYGRDDNGNCWIRYRDFISAEAAIQIADSLDELIRSGQAAAQLRPGICEVLRNFSAFARASGGFVELP